MIAFRSHNMTEWGPIISGMFSNLEYLPIMAQIANKKENAFYGNVWTESDLYLCPQYLRKKWKNIKSQKSYVILYNMNIKEVFNVIQKRGNTSYK